jgi:hypothetical protein
LLTISGAVSVRCADALKVVIFAKTDEALPNPTPAKFVLFAGFLCPFTRAADIGQAR